MHASLEPLDALAEQAARAHQQDQQHQEIHGRLGKLWVAEGHHQSLHQADDHGGNDHTPEGAKPADHHHDEGSRNDFIAHRRMDGKDRRQHDAGETGEPNAEEGHRHHIGLERDAERADHVRALHAGAHHAPEGRALQQKPQTTDAGRRHQQHQHAVVRINEACDEQLAAQLGGNGEGQRRRAEDHAQHLLGDHGQAKGEDQGQAGIGLIEAAKERAFDEDAQQADQGRRDHDRSAKADRRGEHHRQVGADRIEGAVGKIDDAPEGKDQRQAEGDQQVVRAGQEAVQHMLQEET